MMWTGVLSAAVLRRTSCSKKGTSAPGCWKAFCAESARYSSILRCAAAQRKIEEYLADSAQKAFQQPGALVPLFEQLVRLHTAADKTPVHIIQFGDSHTAADEWTGGLRDQF